MKQINQTPSIVALSSERQHSLNDFLNQSEKLIEKRRMELSNQYSFDFEEETPINHPRPTFAFTQVNPTQIPSYYHTREQVIDKKPLAVDLNKLPLAKDLKSSQEIVETRQSFATQASTFVGGDRLSTFQNFFEMPSDRMKLSLFNITDRGEEHLQTTEQSSMLLQTSQMITETGDQNNLQATETSNTSSMIEESVQQQNQSIMNISKDLIVQQFKQRLAISQQITPQKNPILPKIMREPLQLQPFNLILDQALSRDFQNKVVILEEEKEKQITPQIKQAQVQVSNFYTNQKKINLQSPSKGSKSPISNKKTPQFVRKVRSNDRLNFEAVLNTTAQISPMRKLIAKGPTDISPKQSIKTSLNISNNQGVKQQVSSSSKNLNNLTEDKKKRITNKKGLQHMLSIGGIDTTTRNLKQIRQTNNSNQSFTLKKFNQASSSSIQQIKSFQPQLNKLSPSTDLKTTLNQYITQQQSQIEIKSPTLIQPTSPLLAQQQEDQSNHSDYFQFGNSTDGCLLPSYTEEGKSPLSRELISNIKQSQRKYRKQSDQEPESQKLLPNTSLTSIATNNVIKMKAKMSENYIQTLDFNSANNANDNSHCINTINGDISAKSRNIIKENLTTQFQQQQQQQQQQKQKQEIVAGKGQISLNKTLTKKSLENL